MRLMNCNDDDVYDFFSCVLMFLISQTTTIEAIQRARRLKTNRKVTRRK